MCITRCFLTTNRSQSSLQVNTNLCSKIRMFRNNYCQITFLCHLHILSSQMNACPSLLWMKIKWSYLYFKYVKVVPIWICILTSSQICEWTRSFHISTSFCNNLTAFWIGTVLYSHRKYVLRKKSISSSLRLHF